MKIIHPLLTKFFGTAPYRGLGLLGASMIRALTATLDYRIVYADPLVDPVHPQWKRRVSGGVVSGEWSEVRGQGGPGLTSVVRGQTSVGSSSLTPDRCLLTPGGKGPRAIYLLWHEYMIFPLGVRGKGMTVLISQHRDGELITQVLRHLRFRTIRGSTTRGSVAALHKILRSQESGVRSLGSGVRNQESRVSGSFLTPDSWAGKVSSGVVSGEWSQAMPYHSPLTYSPLTYSPLTSLIVTPDGPRGPRRRLAEGSIFLASRLQMPIVCMGFAFDRPCRLMSWDRFAIPRAFSRARAVISPFIDIPPNLHVRNSKNQEPNSKDPSGIGSWNLVLGSSDLEYWRLYVERTLNQLTLEAENWAESGRPRSGEMPMLPHQPAPQMLRAAA